MSPVVSPARLPKPGLVLEFARAQVRQVAIPQATVEAVLSGVGIIGNARVRNIYNGWRSQIVSVTTPEGRVVVRGYSNRWATPGIRHEHSVLQKLEAVGFGAPRLRAGETGETLFVVDGTRFAVLSYVPGSTLTGFYMADASINQLQVRAGRLLGEFHKTLSGFHPDGIHHLGIDPSTGIPLRDVDWHRDVVARVGEAGGAIAAEGLVGSISNCEARFVELDTEVRSADLPTALIHGDFGLHNILFSSKGEPILHDFELTRLDIRAIDLVTSLSRLQPRFRSGFITGLRDVDGLSDSEWTLLPQVWEWYRLGGAIQSCDAYLKHGGDRRLETARRRLLEAQRVQREGLGE